MFSFFRSQSIAYFRNTSDRYFKKHYSATVTLSPVFESSSSTRGFARTEARVWDGGSPPRDHWATTPGKTPTMPLYLDGNEPNYEGQEDRFFSIPALFTVHFYFALQFPPLPAILHENLG